MPKTIAEHQRSLTAPAMCELLPIRAFLDDVMVRLDGSYIAGFHINGAQTYFADDRERDEMKGLLESLLRTIPEESMRVQFRYEVLESATVTLNKYAADRRTETKAAHELDVNREAVYREKDKLGEYLTRMASVYFIWNPDKHRRLMQAAAPPISTTSGTKQKGSVWTRLKARISEWLSVKKTIERTKKEHLEILSQFQSILTGIQTSLTNGGLQPVRMVSDDLYLEIKRALYPIDPDTTPLKDYIVSLRHISAREQLAYVPLLGEREGYMNINGLLWSSMTLKMPPDDTYPGVLRELLTMGFPIVISTQLTVPNQQQVLEQYKKRHKKMVVSQQDMRGNQRIDINAQVTARELHQIQERLIAGSEKTVQLSVTIATRTSKPAYTVAQYEAAERELAVRRQQILHVVSRMNGGCAQAETLGQLRLLIGTLPALADENKRDLDLLTSHAADLLPVEMPWGGTTRSPLMLFDTPYRQLIPFSPFDPDLENANAIIAATSGTGKSVLVGKMLLTCARRDVKVSILERGDSYLPAVEYMGGTMITMSLDSKHTINPFDLEKGETGPSNDQLSFLKSLTRYMIGDKGEGDSDVLETIIDTSIKSAYTRASGRIDYKVPTFADVRDSLAHFFNKNPKLVEMAHIAAMKLDMWVRNGMYANLFDRQTTVDMNVPWLYFNIEKLKDDPRLETAMSLLIAYTTSKRAQGKGGARCITVLDECWALLASKYLAEEVVQLFRTARKRDACVWAVSQAIEDFTGTPDKPNPFCGPILASTAIRLIGRQKGNIDVLREFLHLNQTTIKRIKGLGMTEKGKQSEFVLSIGENASTTHTLRICTVGNEYWILTTYPRERRYRTWWLLKHSHLPLEEAYSLLTKKYPNGLAHLDELPEEKSGEIYQTKVISSDIIALAAENVVAQAHTMAAGTEGVA